MVESVVVTEAASPRAGTIGIFAILETQQLVISQRIVCITYQTPIHEVIRLHDGEPGTHMHGRATHVIGVTHTHHGNIRDISPDNGIGCFGLTNVVSGTAMEREKRYQQLLYC